MKERTEDIFNNGKESKKQNHIIIFTKGNHFIG